MGYLREGVPVGAELSGSARHGFVFFAAQNATVDVEITQNGSSREIDTLLSVYGPRQADGNYPATLATDDDAGWGQQSRIRGLHIEQEGFYLAEVTLDAEAPASTTPPRYRLDLSCGEGQCPANMVARPGLDIRWARYSAEAQAASYQGYAVARARIEAMAGAGTLPASWAVVSDIDETLLSNVQYQIERAELGLGYSSNSWFAWVQRREATPMPGATEMLERVRELGGIIALVSNRKASECPDTEANLQAHSIPYDVVLCRTGTSNKDPRFAMVAEGTTPAGLPPAEVVVFLGDNIQDFPALRQDVRFGGAEGFTEFGARMVLIPNPMYGSWEGNTE